MRSYPAGARGADGAPPARLQVAPAINCCALRSFCLPKSEFSTGFAVAVFFMNLRRQGHIHMGKGRGVYG